MSNKSEIVEYMRSDIVRERFADALGAERNAAPYITSVLLAVANSDKLQECSYQSIYTSALRAATLRLSCDHYAGQAYLVPYGKNATLIVGYKGLYDLAIRTGRYRYINVGKVYEGENVEEDRITGVISINGNRTSKKVTGLIASFQMISGYSKTIHMSVEEIHEHAVKYSKGYNRSDSAWKTNTEAMERKTILRRLISQWGYIDPADAPLVSQDEVEEYELEEAPEITETIEGEIVEHEPIDAEESLRQLGF